MQSGSEGLNLGYHKNTDYARAKRPKEDVTSIYMTEDEAQRIMDYQAEGKEKRKAVALFTLDYKTWARFSDFSRLTPDSVQDGKLTFIQQKTNARVVIPCASVVRQILDEWGSSPSLSQQRFNMVIKEVAREVGLTDMVEIVRSQGCRHIHSSIQKCELISSHTCRRSCLTNLYLNGASVKECMLISGHHRIEAFEKYLKMSPEQTLKSLADNKLYQ